MLRGIKNIIMSNTMQKKGIILFTIPFISAIFLLIASTSSPLYPMNPWVDVNAYFTMGRGIIHGKIPYVDLFDVKGPLVFYLYSIMALISNKSFAGVFIIELILFSLFLSASYKTISLFTEKSIVRLIVTTYVAFATVSSYAFEKGTSVEEICLWAMTYALYFVMRSVKTKKDLTLIEAMIIGVLGAWCFWIKYTMFGLFVGLALFVIVKYMFSNPLLFTKLFLTFWIGFLILSGVILVALVCQGALPEAINSYFFANVSQYSSASNDSKVLSVFLSVIKGVISFSTRNIQISIVVWSGLILAILDKSNTTKLALCLAFCSLLFFDYGGGVRNRYYALVFATFLPVCLGEISKFVSTRGPIFTKLVKSKTVVVITIMILTVLTYLFSDNTRLLRYRKADIPQFKFAEVINQTCDATVLNYDYLDIGIYFATGIDPANKYFYVPNKVMEEEAREEQNQILLNGEVDYVVSVTPIDKKYKKYKLIEQGYFDYDGLTYYLYSKR